MLFTDIALGRNDEVLSPSDSFIRFNREVVSRRSELPQMWKKFIVSLRRYYAYVGNTGRTSPKLVEELYDFLFYYSNGQRKLYQDYMTSRLRDNDDPEYLYKKYHEYFSEDPTVDFPNLMEEVLRNHYVAALAASSVVGHRERLEKRQIHPFIVRTLKYSYVDFWVKPGHRSEYFFGPHYSVSRRQEEVIPLQSELFELDDFSNDRAGGMTPTQRTGADPWMCDECDSFFVAACHTSLEI